MSVALFGHGDGWLSVRVSRQRLWWGLTTLDDSQSPSACRSDDPPTFTSSLLVMVDMRKM